MKRDAHERDLHGDVRHLMALGDEATEAQQVQLRAHLEQCEACRQYAESAKAVVSALRSQAVAADARLVRATQMRVRFHAVRMREARRRVWLMALACLTVGLSATVTIPYVWRLFEWIGDSVGLPTLVWESGFLVFFITPALIAGVSLVARSTRFTNEGER